MEPEELLSAASQAQDKETLRQLIQQGLEAQQGPFNPMQDQWFRDFNDAIHARISGLKEDDDAGRRHLNDLLHVCWLFKKGMEHYIAQGEQAKWNLRDMEDRKPRRWLEGIV